MKNTTLLFMSRIYNSNTDNNNKNMRQFRVAHEI